MIKMRGTDRTHSQFMVLRMVAPNDVPPHLSPLPAPLSACQPYRAFFLRAKWLLSLLPLDICTSLSFFPDHSSPCHSLVNYFILQGSD